MNRYVVIMMGGFDWEEICAIDELVKSHACTERNLRSCLPERFRQLKWEMPLGIPVIHLDRKPKNRRIKKRQFMRVNVKACKPRDKKE